jgi:hypothetical protein
MDAPESERWLPTVGFEKYEVSDQGRVRSWRDFRGGIRREPRLLRQFPGNPYGHLVVSLILKPGEPSRPVGVHRLVLEAFVGARPGDVHACHFPDRDPTNNRLENLRWGTAQENAADRAAHGTEYHGQRHHRARLTDAGVMLMRYLHVAHEVHEKTLAGWFHVDHTTAHRVVTGRKWKHLPMLKASAG